MFVASDGQEYKWTLTNRGPGRSQWTCATSSTNYFVASYDLFDEMMTGRPGAGSRSLSVTDSWIHIAVELLASLTVIRYICLKELDFC